ncbi:MAG: CorA family divalent cation transporter [Candidatus ainarchaeum sp.]|nr:CorA family divalent cation transporter [Candidatus ainarchaeum sp.]
MGNGEGIETVNPEFEARGFCASVMSDGSASRMSAEDLGRFNDVVAKSSLSWIDGVLDNFQAEAAGSAAKLGFSEQLVRTLLKSERSEYEDYGNEMGIMIPAITVHGFDVRTYPLIILIKDNVIVTLHSSGVTRFFRLRRYAETLMKKLPLGKKKKEDCITLLLVRILDENNSRNFEYLMEIEEQGDRLSQQLSDARTPRSVLGTNIYEMKHALVIYLGGMWATLDALNSMRYGDADLLTDDPRILEKITALAAQVNTHIGLAEHLSEVLASGLEVMQSIYNNQLQILNNRLALLAGYLAIIGTALLVPNTLATALSGTAFGLTPADMHWYVGLLLGSGVVSTFAVFYVIKKLGFLPAADVDASPGDER